VAPEKGQFATIKFEGKTSKIEEQFDLARTAKNQPTRWTK